MNVLTEYLVSLGFTVNNPTFQQFNNTLQMADRTVSAVTGHMVRNFGLVTAAISVTAGATAGLLGHLASTDMAYQKFALRMYMSNRSAKELKTTLDALGESIEDAAFIPELRQQFQSLLAYRRSLNPPEEFANQLKQIREIGFEFKRLRLIGGAALEWIGYYLFKYLEEPINEFKTSFKDFNDYISKTMPQWTAKIASALASLVNVGRAAWWAIKNIWEALAGIWDAFPRGVKQITVAFTALSAVMLMSPFGQFLMMLTTALLLIEDFYGYLHGWKSSQTMAPMWKWLIEFFDKLQGSMEFKGFKDAFKELGNSVDDVVYSLKELWKQLKAIDMFKNADWGGFLTGVLNEWLRKMKMLLEGWKFILEIIHHAMQGTLTEYIKQKLVDIQNWVNRTENGGGGRQFPGGSRVMPSEVHPPSGSNDWRDVGAGGRRPSNREDEELDDFMEALARKEGNGRYDQPPHEDEGYWNLGGRYQILEDNWASWAAEAGLSPDAPYSAENQERVARFKVMQYYRNNGRRWDLVAAAWNGGGKGVESYRKYGSESYMAGYVGDVMSNLQNIRSNRSGGAPGGQTASAGNYASGSVAAGYVANGDTVQNNYIIAQLPPNANPQEYGDAISKALESRVGVLGQVKIIHQMRELTGVNA